MNVEAMTVAYAAGKTAATAMLVVGQKFKGSMNVADELFKRYTMEWEAAHLGAILVINSYKDIYTNMETGLISELA